MNRHRFRAFGLGLLAILPAWLGGDLHSWKLGLFALVLAVFGLIYPPRLNFSKPMKWALACVLLWPLIGFFPRIFSSSWHQSLAAAGVDLGWFWTPQPWVLLDAWMVVLLGGYWFICLFGSTLDSHETHDLLRAYAGGVILLAAMALSLTVDHKSLPWWDPLSGIGPFPNRNQTGNLFALSGLMLLALSAHESRNKRLWFLFWGAGAGVLFIATIVNGSRSGVALFLVGAMAWAGWQVSFSRKKKRAAIVFAVSLLLLTLFLFIGGESLDRITNALGSGSETSGAAAGILSGRWEIWHDTARMMMTAPLHGIGLGNYSEIFALFRTELEGENRVIHPDSDYFWWLAEIGVIGMALIGWLVFLVLQPFLQSKKTMGRRLRTAAFIASVLFIGHALVDVSGHRLGTLIPAILWARLTWPLAGSRSGSKSSSRSDSRKDAITRSDTREVHVPRARDYLPAGLMCFIACWFLIPWSGFLSVPLPNTSMVAHVKQQWATHYQESPEVALAEVRRAVRVAPLDWELRYCLGVGTLQFEHNPDAAWQQWSIARKLEPMQSALPFEEGRYWMYSDVGRAWWVWREALRRRNMDKSGLFHEMLKISQPAPELEETLLFLASRTPELRYLVLSRLTEKEFEQDKNRYLNDLKPTNPEHQRIMANVLKQWGLRVNAAAVADYVQSHPEWFPVGWPYRVRAHVENQEYQQAYSLMQKSFPAAKVPAISASPAARREHLRRMLQGSGDVVSLVSFLRFDRDQLSFEQGKKTTLQVLRPAQTPPYVYYLLAEYFAENSDWPSAVGQMQRYGSSVDLWPNQE